MHKPAVIETSKLTKLVLFEACKAFGVSIAGFEHEILDIILRIEQERQLWLQQQNSVSSHKEKQEEKGKGADM